jgi:hypothetical protein
MPPTRKDIEELRTLLAKGTIQKAYTAILAYMAELRTNMADKYGNEAVSGMYQGYLDTTYFTITPPSLKQRDLNVTLLFNYRSFRFEAWLCGRNAKVQRKYWEQLKGNYWQGCRVMTPGIGVDSIIERDLATDFDIGQLGELTNTIKNNTASFIEMVENALSMLP